MNIQASAHHRAHAVPHVAASGVKATAPTAAASTPAAVVQISSKAQEAYAASQMSSKDADHDGDKK